MKILVMLAAPVLMSGQYIHTISGSDGAIMGVPAYDGSCRPFGASCTSPGTQQAKFTFTNRARKKISIDPVSRPLLEYDPATGKVCWDGPSWDGKSMEHWTTVIPIAYRPAFERFLWTR